MDDFLVFTAGMRIKYGIEQLIFLLRITINLGSPFFWLLFSVNLVLRFIAQRPANAVLEYSRYSSGEAQISQELI